MGHLGEKALQNLPTSVQEFAASSKTASSAISKLSSQLIEHCEHCIAAKFTSTISRKASSSATAFLELVGSDICGPFSIQAIEGYKYFITFLDFASRWLVVKLLRARSEALSSFREVKALLENQSKSGDKFRRLRTDNAKEYTSSEFKKLLADSGIRHELSAPYTP